LYMVSRVVLVAVAVDLDLRSVFVFVLRFSIVCNGEGSRNLHELY